MKIPFETRFYWPHAALKGDCRRYLFFKSFIQCMVNRLGVGALQYGPANRRQRYHLRAIVELKAYARTGNQEHLFNVANYAFLEMVAPSVDGAHLDVTVESATRKKFGRNGFI